LEKVFSSGLISTSLTLSSCKLWSLLLGFLKITESTVCQDHTCALCEGKTVGHLSSWCE